MNSATELNMMMPKIVMALLLVWTHANGWREAKDEAFA
jgi:hypothetical protein